MKQLIALGAFLVTTICFGQTAVENYLIKDIGNISIPETMEIQGGNYKKLAKEYQKEKSKQFGFEVSANRIVFQQKGLNNGDTSAFNTYVRVILETTIGKSGDYEKITTKLSATPSELTEISNQLKSQIEKSFSGTGLKLISWDGAKIVTVNGRTALKISYLRQLNDNPKVTVSIYQFHNNDRMHELTLSYRQAEAGKWQPQFLKILESFTITNIR